MDWTVGTFWTVETDSRRIGLIGDRLDSWARRRLGGIQPGCAVAPAQQPPGHRGTESTRLRLAGLEL